MSKCKICRTSHNWDELDDRGRCRSCADAGDAKAKALRAEQPRPPRCCVVYGKPITRPNAKTCPDCKDEYARAYSREYKRSKKQKGNAK